MSDSRLRFRRAVYVVTIALLLRSSRSEDNDKQASKAKVITSFQEALLASVERRRYVQQMSEDAVLLHMLFSNFPPLNANGFLDILKIFDFYEKINSQPSENATRCQWDLYRMKLALTNLKHLDKSMWALTMIDAFGKPGSGILQGNYRWPGSYSMCIQTVSEDNSTLPPFRGQHCWLNLKPILAGNVGLTLSYIPTFQIGMCLPDSCTSKEITALLTESKLLDFFDGFVKFTGVSCTVPNKPVWKESKTLVPLIILVIYLFIITLATIYDLHKRRFLQPILSQLCHSSSKSSYSVNSHQIGMYSPKADDTSSPVDGSTFSVNTETSIVSTKKENEDPFATAGIVGKLILAFSVYTNGTKILNTSPGKASLPVLNGIRVFSITWVILGHTYSVGYAQFDDVLVLANNVGEFTMQTLLQGTVAVDSFFVLSGLLLTYLYLKEHERTDGKISWVRFYIHRYIRLTPTYFLVMFLINNGLWVYWSHGPFWPENNYEGENCYVSWWRSLLYINNFHDVTHQCMGHTWYLANDVQFYVISPIFLITVTRSVPLAAALVGAFALASWITTAVLSLQVLEPGLFDVTTISGEVMNKYLNQIYIKPYCRIGPYLVGMVCGWLLFKTKCNYKMNKIWAIIGWIVTAACNLSVVYGLYDTKPDVYVFTLYCALSRTAWAIGLCWVIFAGCNGYGGIVTGVLNLRIWNPLSRLTYCVYLWHIAFVVFTFYGREVLNHYEPGFYMIYKYVTNVVFSYVGAFFISLAFESPVITIEKIILDRF